MSTSLLALALAFLPARAVADATLTGSWALDRIDQTNLPLDSTYTPSGDGAGVNVYVVDGGILNEHEEFGGRVETGPDFSSEVPFRSCPGRIPSHGTHTAGLVASRWHGVAPSAHLIDVRVLDCKGKTTKERMEEALRWIAKNAVRPAVVNMSVGSPSKNDAIDDAVRELVVGAGIPLVVSAGNEGTDACQHYPSNVTEAIVVGATSDHDVLAPFSNVGSCIDVLAPGWGVLSTLALRSNATGPFYGTSEASPLVAGAVALYLQRHPEATPVEIENALKATATQGVIKDPDTHTTDLASTPNLLLNVRALLARP